MSTPSSELDRLREQVTRLRTPLPVEPRKLAGTRQERLDALLSTACTRGGFASMALCDEAGLPLAVVHSPIDEDRLAGLTAVLGEALSRVARLWAGPRPEALSLDIDWSDKLVFRAFTADDRGYALLAVCPQAVDERGELELTVGAAIELIGAGALGG
jgi:hypothetical protein